MDEPLEPLGLEVLEVPDVVHVQQIVEAVHRRVKLLWGVGGLVDAGDAVDAVWRGKGGPHT